MKDLGPFVLRIFLGLAFGIAGLEKVILFNEVQHLFSRLFGSMGVLLLVVAILLEIGCGLALLLGVYARWAALPLAVLMLGAFVTTFSVGETSNLVSLLREILVMNTGGGNMPVNAAFFAGLLSLFVSGSKRWAVVPDS